MKLSDFVGVPWKAGGRTLEGCDCVGLTALAARELFGFDTGGLESRCHWYDSELDNEVINAVAKKTETPLPGDVLVFSFLGQMHNGLFVEKDRVLVMVRLSSSRIIRYNEGLRRRTYAVYRWKVSKCH